jgi:hypothetical protein
MSGIFHAIGKVFSKIVSVVKKIWKPLLIAVAIYFTAGLALAAMPATASFAAAMPGISTAAGALGIGTAAGATGAGLATSAAVATGATETGAAAAGAGTAGEAALDTVTVTGTAGAAGSGAAAGAAAAGAGVAAGAAAAPPADAGAASAPAPAPAVSSLSDQQGTQEAEMAAGQSTSPGLLAKAGAQWSKMSLADKFLLASTTSNTISGLTSPSPSDIARANKTWIGAFYGTNADGSGGGAVSPLIPTSPFASRSTAPAPPPSSAAPTVAPNPYALGSAIGGGNNSYNTGQSYVPGVGYMPNGSGPGGATLTPGVGAMPGAAAPVNPAILAAQTQAQRTQSSAGAVPAYSTPYSPLIPV